MSRKFYILVGYPCISSATGPGLDVLIGKVSFPAFKQYVICLSFEGLTKILILVPFCDSFWSPAGGGTWEVAKHKEIPNYLIYPLDVQFSSSLGLFTSTFCVENDSENLRL